VGNDEIEFQVWLVDDRFTDIIPTTRTQSEYITVEWYWIDLPIVSPKLSVFYQLTILPDHGFTMQDQKMELLDELPTIEAIKEWAIDYANKNIKQIRS